MTDPTPPTPVPAAPAAPRTFSQDELNAIAAREKDSGKGAGRKERDAELATQLGVTVEELPARLESLKTEADRNKSEAQRAKEAADAAKVTADKSTADAAAERHAVSVERALIRAGIPIDGDDADDILADAVALVRVDQGADADTIRAAVEKVKGRHPAMFTTQPVKPTFTAPPDVRPPSGRQGPPADGRHPQVANQLARRGIGTAKAS